MTTMIALGILAALLCAAAVWFAANYAKTKKELQEALRARDEAQARVGSAERRVDNAERRAMQLQDQVSALSAERDGVKEELRRLNDELKRTAREARKLREDLEDDQSKHRFVLAEAEKMREEIAMLRTENRKLKDQVTSLEANARKVVVAPPAEEGRAGARRGAPPDSRPADKNGDSSRQPDEAAAQREAKLKAELEKIKSRNEELLRRAARSEAEYRRMRNAYEQLLKTYRLIKRSNELLEHELDYRQLGESAPTLNFEGDPIAESRKLSKRKGPLDGKEKVESAPEGLDSEEVVIPIEPESTATEADSGLADLSPDEITKPEVTVGDNRANDSRTEPSAPPAEPPVP